MAFPTWNAEQYNHSQSEESLRLLAESTCTEWVQFVPTWYQNDRSSSEIFPEYDGQTATMESLRHIIQYAHNLGLKVMHKPHVDALNGDWRGTFQPEDKETWFTNYRNMMISHASLAQEENVEFFSIGCEFVELTKSEDTIYWKEIIKAVKKVYSGPLTYSANWWLEYMHIEFWDELDYVGIDAYFNLTTKNEPTLDELISAWEPHLAQIDTFYETWKVPIILTEIGYRSADGANSHPWDWEISAEVDIVEQVLCYQSVIRTFKDKPWFKGIYWWNWEPDPLRGGVSDFGYTPQGKPSEVLLKKIVL